MPDLPPEVHAALEAVKALTAAGRCEADADLYASATALLNAYLMAMLQGPASQSTPWGVPPATVPPPAQRFRVTNPAWGGRPYPCSSYEEAAALAARYPGSAVEQFTDAR